MDESYVTRSSAGGTVDDDMEVIESDIGPFSVVEASLEEKREITRAIIAGSLLLIFGLTVLIALLAAVFTEVEGDSLKGLLEILLPAETALLGSAVGFYFGAESRSS